MKRRTKAQWLSLIQEFEQSGLTQSRFCAERGLNPKYFSLRRTKLEAPDQKTSFIEAVPAKALQPDHVTIHYGPVSIQVATASAETIAQLAKALAA